MTATATERAEPCNVASALRRQALAQPDAPAIHYPTGVKAGIVQYRSSSYAELDAVSDRYARGLAAYGIGRRLARGRRATGDGGAKIF